MKMSEQNELVCKAVVAALAEIGNSKKTTENPFFKKKYAPLSEVISNSRGTLSKHGLVAVQDLSSDEKGITVKTMIVHESGQWIEQSGLTLPIEKNTSQGVGIAVTYGRRYTLSAMLGISSEEDTDGNIDPPDNKKTPVLTPREYDIEPHKKAIDEAKDINTLKAIRAALGAERKKMSQDQVDELVNRLSIRTSELVANKVDGEVTE